MTVKLVRGGDGVNKVSLMQGMKIKVDGKRVNLPYIDIRLGISIMKDGYRVVLRSTSGER